MSRTMIISYIMSVVGFLGLIGVDLPSEAIEKLLNSISNDTFDLVMLVVGALMAYMRTITTSPLAAGLKGWLGKKEEKVG